MATETLQPDETILDGPFGANWHLKVDEGVDTPDGVLVSAVTSSTPTSPAQVGLPVPVASPDEITQIQVRALVRATAEISTNLLCRVFNGTDLLLNTFNALTTTPTVETFTLPSVPSEVDDLRIDLRGSSSGIGGIELDALELVVTYTAYPSYLSLARDVIESHPRMSRRHVPYPY